MLNPVHRSAMTAMTGRSRLGPLAELSRNSTRLERTMASTTTTTTSRCMLSNNPHKTRLALSPPSPQHGRSYATTMAVSFPSLTDKEDSVLVSKTTAANNGKRTVVFFLIFFLLYFCLVFSVLWLAFFLFWICLLVCTSCVGGWFFCQGMMMICYREWYDRLLRLVNY